MDLFNLVTMSGEWQTEDGLDTETKVYLDPRTLRLILNVTAEWIPDGDGDDALYPGKKTATDQWFYLNTGRNEWCEEIPVITFVAEEIDYRLERIKARLLPVTIGNSYDPVTALYPEMIAQMIASKGGVA